MFSEAKLIDLNKTDQTIFNEYCYQAYEHYLLDKPRLDLHKSLLDKYRLKSEAINGQRLEIQHKIDELLRQKIALEENDLTLLDFEIEELEIAYENLVKEREESNNSKSKLLKQNDEKWELIKNNFQVNELNETLIQMLKLRINNYQQKYIPLLEEQMTVENQILDQSKDLENTLLQIENAKVAADEKAYQLQKDVEYIKTSSVSLEREINLTKSQIAKTELDITEFVSQSQEKISKTTLIIRDDTQVIATHAQRIAGWLQELTIY